MERIKLSMAGQPKPELWKVKTSPSMYGETTCILLVRFPGKGSLVLGFTRVNTHAGRRDDLSDSSLENEALYSEAWDLLPEAWKR